MVDTAYMARVFKVAGINVKSTGTTDIISASAGSGKKCVVLSCKVVTASLTGTGTGPTVSLGSNSSTYDNVLYDKTLSVNASEVQNVAPTGGATNYQQLADIGTNGLKFNVKSAAGAGVTAMTVDVYVEAVLY